MASRLVDLLGGLSRLADLGFGLHAGESMRSAALAALLSEKLDLSSEDVRASLYTALLHHVGCTGFAHETSDVFGDELALNRAAARTDLADVPRDVLATFIPALTDGLPLSQRVRLGATALVRGRHVGESYAVASCEVGRHAARRLGLSANDQLGIYHVYELWNGDGSPDHLAGGAIPVASRLARLTGLAALFDTLGGAPLASQAITQRAGGMLDPTLARVFTESADELLSTVGRGAPQQIVADAEPTPVVTVEAGDLRRVASVFADLTDLKSPYFHGHSRGVARLAREAGRQLGLTGDDLDELEVAGLLHDVGRVAVSTRIWEKHGPLTRPEWEEVRLHAYHSERIVSGSDRLSGLAAVVGMHHERLDGSGYHRGTDSAISRPARVIAAADEYVAMTAARPHRPALSPEEATQQLLDDTRAGLLDTEAVEGVLAAAGHEVTVPAAEPPAGLTPRESEVLALLADGRDNAGIAARLGISRRTAEHHVQHIYAKLGTSSRAAAAVFALEHGLLPRPSSRS